MTQKVDPKTFGLHRTTQIEKTGRDHYTLIINRKSRIIMQDGLKILSKAEKIKKKVGDAIIEVRATAPVCSKTSAFLEEHDISVKSDNNNQP